MLKIEAIGNIGNDAEIKQINGRGALAFSIAHSERNRDGGGEKTTWIECLYFTSSPERLQPYLTKGKNVHVRGNVSVSTWIDRQGATRISITCYVSEFDFCGGARSDNQSAAPVTATPEPARPASPAYQSAPAKTGGDPNDDLPF